MLFLNQTFFFYLFFQNRVMATVISDTLLLQMVYCGSKRKILHVKMHV